MRMAASGGPTTPVSGGWLNGDGGGSVAGAPLGASPRRRIVAMLLERRTGAREHENT